MGGVCIIKEGNEAEGREVKGEEREVVQGIERKERKGTGMK